MRRSRNLIVLLLLCNACTPAALPRLQIAVAHGERIGGERRHDVLWVRLSWGGGRGGPR
ncbi:MAG TPA: hypothetical protein VL172_14590 [Kofleriaceae bacterium]|jgi:hypothetical protein|nr:hypothetical protein [Kofleriaceae bacterium]